MTDRSEWGRNGQNRRSTMNNKGPNFMAIAALVLLIVAGGAVGLFFFRSNLDQEVVQNTSDVTQTQAEFTIGTDPWIGYMPLCSNALQNKARSKKIIWNCESDGGNYPDRFRKLRTGALDMAVATVDANLLNAEAEKWPGVIVAVIDQSNGGDALVCRKDSVPTLDVLSNRKDWKIAFTPNSPSHHLLRSIGNDFGVSVLLTSGDWRVEVDGSGAAYAQLMGKTVDCAVLWQPDVAKAVSNQDFVKVHSSADADKLIVDVLMVSRELLRPSNPKNAYLPDMLRRYFDTLRDMGKDPKLQMAEAKAYLKTYDGGKYTDAQVQAMLDGVAWINLRDNGESWFGVGNNPYFGLAETHESALAIIRSEKGKDFLPRFRPSSILNSSFVKTLYDEGVVGEVNKTVTDSLKLRFTQLGDSDWVALKTLGTLRSRRVVFKSGSSELEDFSRSALSEAMSDFKRYPKYRLELQIGYLTNGDVKEAQARATERADSVKQYLIDTFGIDATRVRVKVPEAYEIEALIPKREGEGGRSYRSRLREVRLALKK